MRTTSRRVRLGTLARWILVVTVTFSALALGGLPTVVHIATLVGTFAAFCLAWLGNDSTHPPRRAATVVLGVAVLLVGLTAVQLIPLPMAVLRLLAPENADIWTRAFLPLHEPPMRFAPITLDTFATRLELLRGFSYLFAFLAALQLGKHRERAHFLSMGLVVSALAVSLAALAHPLFGATRVFGVYAPDAEIAERHLAPILNPNCLADYINIGFAIALASLVARRPRVSRFLAGAVVVLLFAAQLWVASRGGIAALILGVAIVLWMQRSRGAALARRAEAGVFAVMIALGIGVTVLGASGEAFTEVWSSDVSKLWMHRQMLPMLKKFAFFGTGRGSFESVFPAFRTDGTGYIVYNHPEQLVLQWGIEWGVPVAIVALGALVWAFRPPTIRARHTEAVGPWVALIVVGVHSLLDMGSEIPANVLALSVAAGMVVGGSGSGAYPFSRWAANARRIVQVGAALFVVGLLVSLGMRDGELYADRKRMKLQALDPQLPRAAFLASLKETILRHPAEPYFPYLAAARAADMHEEGVVAWAGRTLERAPIHGPIHLVLGRFLARSVPPQARVEYRLAFTQAPELVSAVAEIPRLVHSYDDALELLPAGELYTTVLRGLADAVEIRLPATSWRLDALQLSQDSRAPVPLRRKAKAYVSDVTDDAAWCAGDRYEDCRRRASAAIDRVLEVMPRLCDGYELRARMAVAAGAAERGLTEFLRGTEVVEERTQCLVRFVELSRQAKVEGRVAAVLDQIARAGCARIEECVVNLSYVSQVEEARGNLQRALGFIRQAAERDPTDEQVSARTASLASRVGLHSEAVDTFRRLAARHPEESSYREAILREEKALRSGLVH